MDDSWEYILEYFRIFPATPEVFYTTLFLILFLVISYVIVNIILSKKRKRKQLVREWEWFYKLAEANDLSVDEMKALRYLARRYFPGDPQSLVGSILTFDKTVHNFLENYESWYEDYDSEETAELFEAIRDKYFLQNFRQIKNLLSTREMGLGQNIRLTIKTEMFNRFLHTTIEENTKDGLILQSSEFSGIRESLKPDSIYYGYFWRIGDAGYQFPMKLVRLIDEQRAEFEHTENFERKQRRHFFRVDTRANGRFYKLELSEIKEFFATDLFEHNITHDSFSGDVVSLSGGGISFFTDADIDFQSDDLLWIEICWHEDIVYTDIIGRITRIRDFVKRKKIYVEFVRIAGRDRESIIQNVSILQLEKKSRQDKEKGTNQPDQGIS